MTSSTPPSHQASKHQAELNHNADTVVVLVTVPRRELALSLSHALVASQLCACVNVVPSIVSIYQWHGQVQQDEELLLICKTLSSCVDAVVARVKAEGFAEVPETIALPIIGGAAAYLSWLRDSVVVPAAS